MAGCVENRIEVMSVRTRDMEAMMLIDKLISYKRLKLKGKENSFYSCFHIVSKGRKGYDDEKSFIKYKSVERGVKRLCDAKIFVQDSEGYYSINPEYIVLEKEADAHTWRDFLNKLAESGEFETYLLLAKYLHNPDDEKYMDESKIQLYQQTVRENLDNLKADKQVIKQINEALDHHWKLDIEYKGKPYSVDPICYVISRDGTRTYLYTVRKKEFQAFELAYISVKRHSESQLIDREKYKKQLKECWDIDVQNPTRVKVLYDKVAAEENYLDDQTELERELMNYFGKPFVNVQGECIYEGEIRGVNDFKTWIRKYSEYCFVVEPKSLREEIIQGLRSKKERYEYEQR